MKITALTAQIRDPERVNVSVDGKFRFSLDVSQVIDLGIKQGQEIDGTRLSELETESQFGKLYARTLEYTLMRPRSTREVRDYLYKKTLSKKYKNKKGEIKERQGASVEIAERVLTKLQQKGYVDDEKFARYWVENRNQRKGTSMRKLQAELMQKGVSSDSVAAVIEGSERTDADELAKIIAKKRSKYPDETKLKAYLARQGFRYDDIAEALRTSDDC